jgi:NitT/TauT family transport system substrate-binding protein
MKFLPRILGLVLVLAFLLPACTAPAAAPTAAPEDGKLRMSLLPILDVIPFFIADQNGYFKEQGIQVELVPVKSAQERDVLFQTKQADGGLDDLISTALMNKDAANVKAIYTARRSFPDAPMFRVLAAPNSTLKTPADLKGVPIGISQNTVIQYLTDRLLQAEGLAPADLKIVEVTAIPVRFEQLMNGNIKAATLPDPLAQGAEAGGARLIADDTRYPQFSQSVLTFRTDTLKAKPNTVKKFLAAWEKAVNELNAHPEKYQDVLVQQGRVPKSIEGTYKMPPFPTKGVPSQAEVSDVIQWLRDKGLVTRDIPYGDMVDASFLPQ